VSTFLSFILKYFLVFSVLYFGAYYLHEILLEHFQKTVSFSLNNIYLFHFLSSLAICILILFLSKIEKYKSQLGFIYLFTLFFKLFLFILVFKALIFNEAPFAKIDSISMLVPILLFLSFEVVFVSKILKQL
jgi:hypothetical protein